MTSNDGIDVVAALEALLFSSGEPVPVKRLAAVLGLEAGLVEAALQRLAERLDTTRGVELRRVAGAYQLVTRPEYASILARLGPVRKLHITGPALEVLAVVAYQQPVTRAEIENVRGVNSESSLRTLLEAGLIAEVGRKEAPGRPILYATTERFLAVFGLDDLSELPPLESFTPATSVAAEG